MYIYLSSVLCHRLFSQDHLGLGVKKNQFYVYLFKIHDVQRNIRIKIFRMNDVVGLEAK